MASPNELCRMDALTLAQQDLVKPADDPRPEGQGVMKFAFYPPVVGECWLPEIWDRFMVHDWRDRARSKSERHVRE